MFIYPSCCFFLRQSSLNFQGWARKFPSSCLRFLPRELGLQGCAIKICSLKISVFRLRWESLPEECLLQCSVFVTLSGEVPSGDYTKQFFKHVWLWTPFCSSVVDECSMPDTVSCPVGGRTALVPPWHHVSPFICCVALRQLSSLRLHFFIANMGTFSL